MSDNLRSVESIMKSGMLLNAFLDHFPGASFIRDSHSKYLHVNKRFTELFGSADKWLGKTPDTLFPDDFARRMVEEDRKALETGYNVFEKKLSVNGIESTFEIHSFRIDREGEEPLIGGIAIDITEWYNSKQALIDSEERYRTVFQNTGAATIIVDADMNILLANRGFERLSGYSEGEICGKLKWQEFVAPDDFDRLKRYSENRLNGKISVPNEYEFRFIDKIGNVKDIHIQVSLVPGTDRSVASLLDITELKKTQEKLSWSVKNMDSLLRTMPDMIFVLSRDGEYLDYWIEDENALAIPSSSLIGSKITELALDEDKLREIQDSIRSAVETGEIQSVEYDLELKVGHKFYEARLAPYEKDNVIAIIRDITERRNAEIKRIELESRIQHTQKLESLGVLAGGIAHDFNNILLAILGNADLALMSLSDTSPARSSLNKIVNAATTAADLTRQMLAYSGRSDYEVLPLDLNKVVVELAHLLKVSISKKAVLKYRLADQLPLIMADGAQISQILMNLITNASEAIGDTSGIISITTGAMHCDESYLCTTELSTVSGENMYVYVEVSDTGCGIDKSVKTQIFEPFFTTKYTGRGLGLSSVLGIIRAHKGAIKVYSEKGEGTTFKILIPAYHPDSAKSSESPSGIEENWIAEGTVLFADDEDTVLAVGRNMLEHLGFDVLTAEDGQQAVELFKHNSDKIVLVILDLTMPHLSGDEVYREIRRIRKDIPVIISSGFSRQDVMHRFSGKHLAGFIQKPYRIEDISAVIKSVLYPASDESPSE